MAQRVIEALQNQLRSNLVAPKAIFSQHKLLGDKPPSIETPATVYGDELSANLF